MKTILRSFLSAIVAVLVLSLACPAYALDTYTYYHTDVAGTPLLMTDDSGAKVWEAVYMPFGEEVEGLTSSLDDNNRTFVGKELDAESGFSYFGARYMSTEGGRFLAPDAVRTVDEWSGQFNARLLTNPQRQNPYAYSLNNPYAYVDPDGNAVIVVFGLALLGAVLAGNLGTPNPANAPESVNTPLEERRDAEAVVNTLTGASIGATLGAQGPLAAGKEVAEELIGFGFSKKTLRKAAQGKGNFGIGSATKAEADKLGKNWVGEGYRVASDGKTLVSKDGLRAYRPPTYKKQSGRHQANFEQRSKPSGPYDSNGHLDIKD